MTALPFYWWGSWGTEKRSERLAQRNQAVGRARIGRLTWPCTSLPAAVRPLPSGGRAQSGPRPCCRRLRSRQPRRPFPACFAGRAAGPSGGPHGAVRGGSPDSLEPGAGRAPLPACRGQVWPRRGRGCAFLPARPFLTHPGRVQHLPPLLSLRLPRPGLESRRESEYWKSRAGREPQASFASGTHSL